MNLFKKKKVSGPEVVSLLTYSLLLAASIYSTYIRDYTEMAIGLFSLLAIAGGYLILTRLAGLTIAPYLHLVMSGLVFAAYILGRTFNFYDNIPIYDKLLHFSSGLILSLLGLIFFFCILPKQGRELPELNPVLMFVFISGLSLSFLVLWEVLEFGLDRLTGSNLQEWQQGGLNGLIDTMGDLMVGWAGSLLASGAMTYCYQHKPDFFYQKLLASYFAKREKD